MPKLPRYFLPSPTSRIDPPTNRTSPWLPSPSSQSTATATRPINVPRALQRGSALLHHSPCGADAFATAQFLQTDPKQIVSRHGHAFRRPGIDVAIVFLNDNFACLATIVVERKIGQEPVYLCWVR